MEKGNTGKEKLKDRSGIKKKKIRIACEISNNSGTNIKSRFDK